MSQDTPFTGSGLYPRPATGAAGASMPGPAGPHPDPRHETALRTGTVGSYGQPVAVSTTPWDFCVNTLKYIGEHPFQFALNVGTAMAVSFGVKTGIVALGIGLGPLALGIAAAMLTSVILTVGRKLIKGEEISARDLVGKSLFSGLIAGILGAFLGGELGDTAKEVKAPSNVTDLDLKLRPNALELPPADSVAQSSSCSIAEKVFVPGVSNPVDQYSWAAPNWIQMEHWLQQTGQDYVAIGYNDTHTVEQLLAADRDWVVFLDAQGNAHQVMHNHALKEIAAYAQEQIDSRCLQGYDHIAIQNHDFPDARVGFAPFDPDSSYHLKLNTGSLIDNKDIYHSFMDHELDHVRAFQESRWDHLFGDNHAHEVAANNAAFENGNHAGFIEGMSRIVLNIADVPAENIPPELAAKLKEAGSIFDLQLDNHPSYRDRILEAMKHAAQDQTLDTTAFEARLQECQNMLNRCNLGKDLDLLDQWCQAQEQAAATREAAAQPIAEAAPAASGDILDKPVNYWRNFIRGEALSAQPSLGKA